MLIHTRFAKYFDEVRKCGSMRRAARNLHVASSAVNRQILKVEEELGTKLFERSSNGLHLTESGRIMSHYVQRVIAAEEHAMADLAALHRGSQSIITIAAPESVIAHFLPPALVEFHAEHPDISTVFKAASDRESSALLVSRDADIALAFDPLPIPEIKTIAFAELPVGAVLTVDHPLAGRSSVTLAECAAYPIVLPDHSWPLRDLLDQRIADEKLTPQVKTSSNSVEFLRDMVNQHLGVGFQTIIGIESIVEKNELCHISLSGADRITQTFAVLARAEHVQSSPLKHLIGLLAKRMSDYAR